MIFGKAIGLNRAPGYLVESNCYESCIPSVDIKLPIDFAALMNDCYAQVKSHAEAGSAHFVVRTVRYKEESLLCWRMFVGAEGSEYSTLGR